jgi:methyltransferase-like protein 6
VDEVRTMFREAGLVEEGAGGDGEATPVRYCCVHNENKRKGILMKRVFVHGVWRKPA